MRKKTLLLVMLLTFLTTFVNGQSFYKARVDRALLENSDTYNFSNDFLNNSVIDKLDSIYSNSARSYSAYTTSQGILILTDCSLDTYTIEGENVSKQFNEFTPFNCNNYLFERDNKLNIVVGYGSSGETLAILQYEAGSWIPLDTKNKPSSTTFYNYIQTTTGILALPVVFNNLTNTKEKASTGYFLDWETKEWRELELAFNPQYALYFNQSNSSPSFETEDFFLTFLSYTEYSQIWNVVEKETGKIYKAETQKNLLFSSPIHEIEGNTIFFQNPVGQLDSLLVEPSLASAIEIGQFRIPTLPAASKEALPLSKEPEILFSIGLLFLVLSGISIIGIKNKKSTKTTATKTIFSSTLGSYILLLQKENGKLLTTQELDQIIEVTKLENLESQRIKRSRLINDINKKYQETNGKDLINRSRISKDRRFIKYLITS